MGAEQQLKRAARADWADMAAASKPVIAAVEGHAVAGGLEFGTVVRSSRCRTGRSLWRV